jgi:hypothetical protein
MGIGMAEKSIVIGGRLRIPADVFELDAFRRWSNSARFPKRGRISFLNGRIEVDMNAEHIAEYWLMDCRGEQIHFELLTRGDGAFVENPPNTDGFRRSPVLARSFRLSRERSQIGHWRYKLEHVE